MQRCTSVSLNERHRLETGKKGFLNWFIRIKWIICIIVALELNILESTSLEFPALTMKILRSTRWLGRLLVTHIILKKVQIFVNSWICCSHSVERTFASVVFRHCLSVCVIFFSSSNFVFYCRLCLASTLQRTTMLRLSHTWGIAAPCACFLVTDLPNNMNLYARYTMEWQLHSVAIQSL